VNQISSSQVDSMNTRNTPQIDSDFIYSNNNCKESDCIRSIVIDYEIPYTEASKLIGKTEEETASNINEYRKSHKVPDVSKYAKWIITDDDRYKPRYGYNYVDGELVENEYEQRIIKIITGMRKRGYSFEKIAGRLNNFGIKTKRGSKIWHISILIKICKRNGA